jgi:hypothetical protein
MTSAKSTGRIVGVLLVLQLAGLMVPFILLHPVTDADYLSNAAAYSAQIKTAVLLFFANGALTIGISIVAWPVFRQHSAPMAMWLIILGVIMFVLQAVDNVHIMTMLSLSRQYVQGAISGEIANALATTVRMTRRWAHYPVLFAIDFWLMMLYAIVLRFGLAARVLAAFGLFTVLVQFFTVPLPGFLEYGINTMLGVPMAVGILVFAVWLMVKGFEENRDSLR